MPRDKVVAGQKIAVFEPQDFHYLAIVSAVYNAMTARELGKKDFRLGKKQRRIDADHFGRQNRELLGRAFGTATNMLHHSGLVDNRSGKMTKEGRKKSLLRYHGSYVGSDNRLRGFDELVNSRQTYEETLGFMRPKFYRVTEEPTREGKRYFVWPMPPGGRVPGPASKDARQAIELAKVLNHFADPRRTNEWHIPDCSYRRKELDHWLPSEKSFNL